MRRLLLRAGILSALVVPICAGAQTQPPYAFSGNFGFFSQYVFRGLTQTNGKPALQGEFDYTHSSGLYLGTWASNISWLTDFGSYTSASMEWDFYGGYRASVGELGYDLGLLRYAYPGTVAPDANRADTLEGYAAVTWKWLSVKLSYSLGGKTFGVADSRGTYYLDLSGTYPMTNKLAVLAHYGIQKYRGSSAAVENDSFASYSDWKLGASYALTKESALGAIYTGTRMDETQKAFYSTPTGRDIGKPSATIYLQRTF